MIFNFQHKNRWTIGFLIYFFFLNHFLVSEEVDFSELDSLKHVVLATKQIKLSKFPGAFNPSLLKVDEGFLLSFRYQPERSKKSWISYIGLVLLNEKFEPISEPELLNTRLFSNKVPSQSEDARLFSFKKRIFLVYNDNMEVVVTSRFQRRDMYLGEVIRDKDNRFSLSTPLNLDYELKRVSQFWQKNWSPFEWDGKLLFSYTVNPHEVLYVNRLDGRCYHYYDTKISLDWKWGDIRGGTPAQLISDNEYLAFFHSGVKGSSPYAPLGKEAWHYFAGAYLFSSTPPFHITRITPVPINGEGFYTSSDREKRVIFPGGFVVSGPLIYLAYGKDDEEVWVAILDKEALITQLVSALP